ncbi:MAG: DUF5063 domain-containing protein [Salinivirgaceae bacterium]|nr:DUF5063 domain-containing protein [Salinivirgaceae bacterium]
MEDIESVVYNDRTVAFTALANQFCTFIDRVATFSQKDFVDNAHKLLALLYVKALSLPQTEPTDPDMIEKTVTQEEWDEVFNAVALKMGKFDKYKEIEQPIQSGAKAEMASIAEGFADIFQDLKDYTSLMSYGSPEMMNDAIWECTNNFRQYWGQRLVNILRVLHLLQYSGVELCTTDARQFDENKSRRKTHNNEQD